MAKSKEWLTPEGLEKIKAWARLGLTNEQIAKNMGISSRTLARWQSLEVDGERPICHAIKTGRAQPVTELENAMYKKAIGFYEGEHYYPPDNVSMIYLLKNWARDRYQERPKTSEELEAIKLDNRIKELQVKALELSLQDENPQISKLDELLSRIDSAAELKDE